MSRPARSGGGTRSIQRYEADTRVDREATTSGEDIDSKESMRKQQYDDMMKSYASMMDTYAEQQKALAGRTAWAPIKTRNAKEPDELTVTHINQTKDLHRAQGIEAMYSENQSSEEWLKTHNVEHLKLSLKDLVDKGKIARPQGNLSSGKVQQHIQFEAADINEFEYRLNIAIELYTKRIKWLLQGSRRMFGMLKRTRVGLLVDASDANCGFGRMTPFQESLMHLIDEQLSNKKSLYVASFGSDVAPLWSDVMDVNCRTTEEVKIWVNSLRQSGGCNLLKALKHIFRIKELNTICVVLGSVPDQHVQALCDYMEQLGVGRDLAIQTIAYDCTNHQTNVTLRRLAEDSGGRYHCYASACEEQIYTGTDISLLLKEVQKAQDVINKIKDMKQGLLGTALVSVMDEISSEVAKLPQSRFLPRPPGHENPLRLEMPKFQPASSEDWLSKHGLKAQSLDLYQVLAPNAYSFREEFIPVIRKTVQSQVHGKAMAQFQWHDGSMKNIHVDLTQLFEYQKQLGASVKIFEKRIDWLSSASRKIFGTIAERNILLLVDLSVSNASYLVHIQHSLRLVMEQQIANKDYFNIIGFGGDVKKFRPTLVKPTPENLQSAWQWVLEQQCEGSRNFLGALRAAVENDEESRHEVEVEGMYLFTSGIPDQMFDLCISYVEEAAAGRNLKLNVILFNVDDYDSQGAIPSRYANITKTAECLRTLAHCSNGRFHWFRETGIIESDDIAAVSFEIEKAINFSKKCAMLVDSVKKKYGQDSTYLESLQMFHQNKPPPLPQGTTLKALPPPKDTVLSQTRKQLSETRDREEQVPKALAWRPSSAGRARADDSPAKRIPRPSSAKDPMKKVRGRKNEQTFFYTDTPQKNDVGSVYKRYANTKSVRKGFPLTQIQDKEDQISTKEWFRMYSLNKLKLDLNKLVSGPDCKHVCKPVKALNKHVEAKACNIFPTINVQGTLKHLQLLPHELVQYEEQIEHVLRRYLKRLQWLLSGSRRVFSTVVEKQCVVLIDTSGSMEPYMDEVKKELASLIWEQLYRNRVSFNLISFSKTCEHWQSTLMEPTEENCHDAVKWVSYLVANGNTCTLDALQMAFDHEDVKAMYMLTDGKPDTSTSLVLREVTEMNTDRQVVINTISFNCEDSTANNFLKMLATENGGRYHRCHGDFDADRFAHRLLSEGFQDPEHPALPVFEGDDLRRLGNEITQARRFLSQSRSYRAMYESVKKTSDDPGVEGVAVTVGPGQPRLNRPKSSYK